MNSFLPGKTPEISHSNVVGPAVGRASNLHGQPAIWARAANPAMRVISDNTCDGKPEICSELHNRNASSRNNIRREVYGVLGIREHDPVLAAPRDWPRGRLAEGLHDGKRRADIVQPPGV